MRSAWLRAGVMTMALMGVTCAGQTPQDPQSLRRQAARLLDRGDPVGAAALLSGPPAAGLLYLRGIAAADRGLVGQADSLLRLAALASNPESALAAARRADLALAVGRSEEARALADSVARALEQGQRNSANDWLALGIAYRVLGVGVPAQFKDALTALDRAVAADSNLIDGYLRLGGLLLEKYNGPDARAAFQQALRHDPGNPRAELGLADVALFDGDREAFRLVDRVVAAAPRLAQAHAMIARLELDSEHSELAVAAANRAIALDSTLLEAWATKAAVFALAGDSVRLADIERSVGEWHRRPAAFYAAIAEAVARQRRYAEAAEFAARGVASDSTNAVWWSSGDTS